MTVMNRWVFVGLAGVAALLLLACGGSEEAPPGATPTATAVQDMEGTLHVTLNEWSITQKDNGATFTANAGAIMFEVHNDGVAPHELAIIKTDLAPDALPVAGIAVDEEAAGELVGRVTQFPGGEIRVKPYDDLEPGRYALICNIPGHYQQGMFAELIVR